MTYDYNNNNFIGERLGVMNNNDYITPENSSVAVSPVSDLTDYYNAPKPNPDQNLVGPQMLPDNYFDYSGLLDEDLTATHEQSNLDWFENIDEVVSSSSESLWNIGESDEDFWFCQQQQQFNNNNDFWIQIKTH